MRVSLTIVSFFVLGLILGLSSDQLSQMVTGDVAQYILYVMMLVVGIGIGCDRESLVALKNQNKRVLLLPLGTIAGSLLGALLAYPLIQSLPLQDALGVASGITYYSVSSIILSEYRGAEVGTIALLSNVMREILTILAAPLMVRYFGRLSVISSAGAASIDTLLPVVTRFSGKEFVVLSVAHGLVMELCVPLLVTIFATI